MGHIVAIISCKRCSSSIRPLPAHLLANGVRFASIDRRSDRIHFCLPAQMDQWINEFCPLNTCPLSSCGGRPSRPSMGEVLAYWSFEVRFACTPGQQLTPPPRRRRRADRGRLPGCRPGAAPPRRHGPWCRNRLHRAPRHRDRPPSIGRSDCRRSATPCAGW